MSNSFSRRLSLHTLRDYESHPFVLALIHCFLIKPLLHFYNREERVQEVSKSVDSKKCRLFQAQLRVVFFLYST